MKLKFLSKERHKKKSSTPTSLLPLPRGRCRVPETEGVFIRRSYQSSNTRHCEESSTKQSSPPFLRGVLERKDSLRKIIKLSSIFFIETKSSPPQDFLGRKSFAETERKRPPPPSSPYQGGGVESPRRRGCL